MKELNVIELNDNIIELMDLNSKSLFSLLSNTLYIFIKTPLQSISILLL